MHAFHSPSEANLTLSGKDVGVLFYWPSFPSSMVPLTIVVVVGTSVFVISGVIFIHSFDCDLFLPLPALAPSL